MHRAETVLAALLGHVVVGVVWFVFLGSLLIALEDRGAFWAGVATWVALVPLLAALVWAGRRWWSYALEAAWLAAWAAVIAAELA
jgi:hypothetical protein